MSPRLSGAVALLVLLGLAACKGAGEPANQGLGVTAVQFQDVAVPDGFLLKDDLHESYSREDQGWRHGHFVYTHNTAKLDDACAHLRARMPQHNWLIVGDERPDEASRVLKFTRGRYTVEYRLQRQDGVTRMVVDYQTETVDR